MASTLTQALELFARKPLKDFTDRNGVKRSIGDITAKTTPALTKRQARENNARNIGYRVHLAPGVDFGKIFRVYKNVQNRHLSIYIGRAS